MVEKVEVHFDGQVAVKAIIVFKNKILLVRGVDLNESWDLPGGHLHVSETPAEGIVREVYEELGISIIPTEIVYSEQFFHPGPQKNTLMLVYIFEVSSDNLQIAADELESIGWYGENELPGLPIYQNCQNAINYYLKNR